MGAEVPNKSELFFTVFDCIVSRLPPHIRRRLLDNEVLLTDMFIHGGRIGLLNHSRLSGVRGKWIEAVPDLETDTGSLTRALGAFFLQLKDEQRTIATVYQPATGWASLLDAEWSDVVQSLKVGDSNNFDSFLRGFFRNGAISGLWGGRRMFESFVNDGRWSELSRLAQFVRQLEAWHREAPQCDLDDLDEARVGQPWGYDVEGRLVAEPTFEYNTLASQISRLLAHVVEPVILEIGGGFGGFARQIMREMPNVHYIGIDLPENIVVQSWYLKHSLPDRRVEFQTGADTSDITEVDALLLPNWAIERLNLPRLDLVVNVHSFGEMNLASLEAYFGEIVRLAPEWVFHDNLAGPRRDSLYGIPSSEYPDLPGYQLIAACESRWPRYGHSRGYPCREQLFQRIRS